MDDIDRHLVTLLEREMPLHSRPFHLISQIVGTDEADVLLRISRLQQVGVIQQIAGIFDIRKMGYRSTLIAMKLPPENVEKAATSICTHPGVIDCFQMAHEYNLWFRLMLPPEEVFEEHTRKLQDLAHAEKSISLFLLKRFKDVTAVTDMEETVTAQGSNAAVSSTVAEKEFMENLQAGFPLTDEPYRKIARDLNLQEERVFEIIRSLSQRKLLKHLAASIQKRTSSKKN